MFEDATEVLDSKIRAGRREVSISFVDIERICGAAKLRHAGLSIEGDFWDLNSWDKVIHRRIDPSEVIDWPRTICWVGGPLGGGPEFVAEWHNGYEAMIKALWNHLDVHDYIVGHNVKAFDKRHWQTAFRELDLGLPSTYALIDTLSTARTQYGDESRKLDTLNKRDGIDSKTDTYKVTTARRALGGDKAAQAELEEYNVGDWYASKARYLRDLPYMKTHPNVAPNSEELCCTRCASTKVVRLTDVNGEQKLYRDASNGVQFYLAYRCLDCKGMFRGGSHARGNNHRSIA